MSVTVFPQYCNAIPPEIQAAIDHLNTHYALPTATSAWKEKLVRPTPRTQASNNPGQCIARPIFNRTHVALLKHHNCANSTTIVSQTAVVVEAWNGTANEAFWFCAVPAVSDDLRSNCFQAKGVSRLLIMRLQRPIGTFPPPRASITGIAAEVSKTYVAIHEQRIAPTGARLVRPSEFG